MRLAGVRLARFVPRLFRIDYLEEILANRLNLHIDESGNQDLSEGRYIVAVVLHDHSSDIATPINRYEERLAAADLPDVPFHGKDLLHGNERYSIVTPGDRKRLLAQFARFVRELPISFFTLQYDTSNVHNRNELEARIRRDLASLVFARLAFFQEFEMIAVYYDNGQSAVSIALHDALDYVLAKTLPITAMQTRMLAGFSRSQITSALLLEPPMPTMPVNQPRRMNAFSETAVASSSRSRNNWTGKSSSKSAE